MYSFCLSLSPNRIWQAYNSKNNRPWVPEIFSLDINNEYIEIWKDKEYMGCLTITPIENEEDVLGIHTTLLPKAYGQASQIGKEFFIWFKNNFNFSYINTLCAENNRLVISLAKKCGFIELGFYKEVELRGKIHRMFLYQLQANNIKEDEVI